MTQTMMEFLIALSTTIVIYYHFCPLSELCYVEETENVTVAHNNI